MASPFNAACCALVALAFWTALGYPVVRRLLPAPFGLPFAPLAGWAMHGVVALPVFFVVPLSAIGIAVVALVVLALAWLVPRVFGPGVDEPSTSGLRVSPWAWAGAALLAIVVAAAIVPKYAGDLVVLSDQVFDHAKVSMVDDIARLGLPPGNPYFADDGASGRLSYYYLLHFSSAELARLLRVSGWEADIAMTFFAAFVSLSAMMALAVRLSGRTSASWWVVAIAASSSSRVLLEWLFGGPALDAWFEGPGGFGGWLFQAPWVPQHLISTACVLFAVLLMTRLARRPDLATATVLALVCAAAFESSTWVGGIDLALVAAVVVPLIVRRAEASTRMRLLAMLATAGALTLVIVWPLLHDQYTASKLRNQGFPLAIRLFDVVGPSVPVAWRRLLDAPAYWLLLLPVVMSSAYLPGVAMLWRSIRGRVEPLARALAAVAVVAMVIAWLLVSTIADNNDLGWRAGLLGVSALTVFAAAGLSTWIATGRRLAVALAVLALLLGLPESAMQITRNVVGHVRPEGAFFARMPEMWREVRAETGDGDRVANNPRGFAAMTPWPVNIAWSLLADRRSCYAGWELTQVFTAVPHDRLRRIDEQFIRVFGGEGTPDDIHALATVYDCRVAVVTAEDGAWTKDPFADGVFYSLTRESAGRWRIYKRR